MHLLRLRRFGDPLRERPAPQPKINANGYRMLYLPEHPNAYRNSRVLEHVVVMSGMLGRPLRKGESVHHRNGQRADNRPVNLELWASRHPSGQRVSDLLAFARDILEDYGHLDDPNQTHAHSF